MNKRVISLLLALAMVFSLLPGTAIGAAAAEADGYTYRFYNPTMPDCWNPHTWTGSEASTLLSYLETPLVDMTVSDSEKGIYQWVYLAAESITDVTADHQEDLVTYGADSTTATSGFVYEIALNPYMKWQDGTAINADTYIYSMQQLLDPDMQNYRANNYCTGNSAIAGAYAYYHSNEEGYYVPYTDVYSSLDEAMAATDVLLDVWGFWNAKGYIDADGNECPQYVSLTDETVYSADGQGNDAFSGAALYRDYGSYFEPGTGYDSYVVVWQVNPNKGVTYDVVGLYKVDDYTIRYVTQSYVEWYYLYTSLTSNWIVHEELYESCKETGSYGTSLDTTMSYGPYMLESMDLNSQIVLTQNPNHYEYTQNSDGTLSSKTDFLVDGANVEQWQATKVVWSLMGYDSAKAAFLEGQLDSWEPSGDDLLAYANSERLYKAEETYTMRLFFNTDVEALQAMDAGETDYAQTNAIVLSNENFRKAFSLAIDRADWVTATSGYNPALGLMNDLYFYDVYNDPASSYRSSDEAMAAMCDLYGVSYTDDTLQAAYDSLTGYDLTQAKALMAQACDELVEAGLYTEGEDIYIQIGWTNGALTSEIWAQAAKLTAYLNAAAADSGFGTITLNPVGYSNRYNNVPGDQLPIGYGAWGGAAFYPFNMMQVYLNPNYVGTLHEGACWDPLTETLTLTLDGEAVTMTWAEWSQACTSGAYRSADFATKLTITSALESQYLAKYYCIPLASSTSCSLLSHKLDYYTGTYNIMYDFGGLRLMRFNYSDAEWADYIASGDLDYGATELPTDPETEPTETEATEPEEIPTLTGDYTYDTSMAVLPENWNPHTWTASNDDAMLQLLTTPFVDLSVDDSEKGTYQWIYLAAEAVTDVTAQCEADLVTYGASDGSVFEIALNPDMKWQDGTPINADSYLYSMEKLLNPGLQNYRANTYVNSLAGAEGYHYAGQEIFLDNYSNGVLTFASLNDLVLNEDGTYTTPDGNPVYIATTEGLGYLNGNSLNDYVAAYGSEYFDVDAYASLTALADESGNVVLTEESTALLLAVISVPSWGEGAGWEPYYLKYVKAYPAVDFDTVGIYKVDDYTLRFVTRNATDLNSMLQTLTSNWLVYPDIYETGSYGTNVGNTMSYGPYKLIYVSGSRIMLTQNENHYEYTRNADGTLSSVTDFQVDGQQVAQWQAQNYVIYKMESEEAKSAFLAGQLDDWAPDADNLYTYNTSERLYQAPESYTMSLFFNSNQDALIGMDNAEEYQNTNSVVLSNDKFREAFSLAIDRADWVTSTPGYKANYALLNDLYYYDLFNDPESRYRDSRQAMAAMCDLYGVSYTEETLETAYASITGYDLTKAQALMAQACQELVEAGLYTEGEEIVIHVAYQMYSLSEAHYEQVNKLTAYLNAAAEGSGFGSIQLLPIGDCWDRYDGVPNGKYAIGYGAWGGNTNNPFGLIGVYLDSQSYYPNELGCWNPASEELTITLNDEAITKTYTQWCQTNSFGEYATADFDTRLTILAALEEGFLAKHYRIPLADSCQNYLLSYQVDYYTAHYSTMYSFGGLRLMKFNYTDTEWADYAASGELDYGGSDDSGTTDDPEIPDVEGTPTAEFFGNSLSLNGDIGVNFYTSLNDAFLADTNPHIAFIFRGETLCYGMDSAQPYTDDSGNTLYRFSYNVAVKEMADEITAQLCVSDGPVSDPVTYSVAAYYDAICQQFSREEKPELFSMVEAMLNYGAAAQEYFGYNTDNLANAAVSAAVPENVDASAYAAVVSDTDPLLSYAGMSLVLESNTALRVFFRAVNGADLSGYVFTIGGETVTPVQKDGLWYVELSGIAAKDLDKVCTVTAGDVTVQCSALTYVYNVLQKADALDEKLVSLCKALFAYSQTADAYFATQN